jgi:hypothetical protein
MGEETIFNACLAALFAAGAMVMMHHNEVTVILPPESAFSDDDDEVVDMSLAHFKLLCFKTCQEVAAS